MDEAPDINSYRMNNSAVFFLSNFSSSRMRKWKKGNFRSSKLICRLRMFSSPIFPPLKFRRSLKLWINHAGLSPSFDYELAQIRFFFCVRNGITCRSSLDFFILTTGIRIVFIIQLFLDSSLTWWKFIYLYPYFILLIWLLFNKPSYRGQPQTKRTKERQTKKKPLHRNHTQTNRRRSQ